MTASIGVAHIPDASIHSISDWIGAADSALYDAKALGRNRAAVYGPAHAAQVEAAVLTLTAYRSLGRSWKNYFGTAVR